MKPVSNSKINLNFWHGIRLKSGFGKPHAIAIFDKSKSWIKDTTLFNYKKELELQRLSFDLAEVYCRRMNQKIKTLEYGELTFDEIKNQCSKIYKEYEQLNYQILSDDRKSVSEKIQYWRPIVDKMLEVEK